jgi:hypothetical protein
MQLRGELGCDYISISVEVGDAVEKLYAIHQRNENARKSVKRNNSRHNVAVGASFRMLHKLLLHK